MKKFVKICKKEQMELKAWLEKLLKAKYKEVINEDGFLYAKGDTPILLTAHMDTVHENRCKDVVIEKHPNQTIISSPQGIGGDDRCGIWIIWMILTKTKYRPSVLFCEDEEIGGVGSNKFTDTDYVEDLFDLKYMIELDRAHNDDAVYYDCGNEAFKRYIKETIGYKEDYGSFSDISHLSPVCDVASVNLSCGYYNAHTLKEYVVYEEMFTTYKMVKVLLSKAIDAKSYDYKEVVWYNNYNSGYSWYNYPYSKNTYKTSKYYEIYFQEQEDIAFETIEATSYKEAIGIFLMERDNLRYSDIVDVYNEYGKRC